MTLIAIDFETRPIAQRPDYPPEPVGVALYGPQHPVWREPRYMAWGHASDNNIDRAGALRVLEGLWRDAAAGKLTLVCHNTKFDYAVAMERLGLPPLPRPPEDTMMLAYLCEPHARKLGLKELAEAWLYEPPAERDALHDWIWENRAELRAAHGTNVVKTQLGAWIWAAPGGLVARYAIGDVERTIKLRHVLRKIVDDNGMTAAYAREMRLMPILMENEREGLRVDVAALSADVDYYTHALGYVERWMCRRLGGADIAWDNDAEVAEAFVKHNLVRPEDWKRTKTGRLSVAKDALPLSALQDRAFALALGYRNRLTTALRTFMTPWLAQAQATGGRIHTTWNQVHNDEGGARTGRLSTRNPSLLNISKDFSGRSDGYEHPNHLDVDPLPLTRRYLLPDDGGAWLSRDFSGQEVRVFAHFEQGALMRAYQENPRLDPHNWIRDVIAEQTGRTLERGRVKNVTFARLYGGGRGAVMAQARCTEAEALEIMAYHDAALPGRKSLVDALARMARCGEPIRTWGGRCYFVEPPRVVDGKLRTFEYKLINYLVQGSSADATKEALIRWHGHPERRARFLVAVHDEINVSAPVSDSARQMRVLKECMDGLEFAVPMLSEGARGPSWGALEAYADPEQPA